MGAVPVPPSTLIETGGIGCDGVDGALTATATASTPAVGVAVPSGVVGMSDFVLVGAAGGATVTADDGVASGARVARASVTPAAVGLSSNSGLVGSAMPCGPRATFSCVALLSSSGSTLGGGSEVAFPSESISAKKFADSTETGISEFAETGISDVPAGGGVAGVEILGAVPFLLLFGLGLSSQWPTHCPSSSSCWPPPCVASRRFR